MNEEFEEKSSRGKSLSEARSFTERLAFLASNKQLTLLVVTTVFFVFTFIPATVLVDKLKGTKEQLQQTERLERVLDELRVNSSVLVQTLEGMEDTLGQLADDPSKKAALAQLSIAKKLAGNLRSLSSVGWRESSAIDWPSLISVAYADDAQASVQSDGEKLSIATAKLYIVGFVFMVLGITFVGAIVAVFTTANTAVLSFAIDTIKTLLGFFIGVGTTFMGVAT